MRHIIENVIMDEDPENTISEYLAERPTKIPAGPVCAANRDRLFWLDFSVSPMPGERLEKGTQRNVLTLVEDSHKCDIWDEGWDLFHSSKGTFLPYKDGKHGNQSLQTQEASTSAVQKPSDAGNTTNGLLQSLSTKHTTWLGKQTTLQKPIFGSRGMSTTKTYA